MQAPAVQVASRFKLAVAGSLPAKTTLAMRHTHRQMGTARLVQAFTTSGQSP